MELELVRTYYPNGTNGDFFFEGKRVCSSIELPWLDNKSQVSCIPEGRYELRKRYSAHFGWHLQVMKVKNRDLILIHPANDAIKELKGCIAPVSILKAEGKGLESKIALKKVLAIVFPILDQNKSRDPQSSSGLTQFFLTIKS